MACALLAFVIVPAGVTADDFAYGRRLYLDRLWRQEVDVARDLEDRAVQAPPPVAEDVVLDGLQRLFTGEGADAQRKAAAAAA